MQDAADNGEGTLVLWKCGATCITAVVIITNIKILVIQHRTNLISFLMILFGIIVFFASAIFINDSIMIDYNWFNIYNELLTNPNFYMTLVVIVTVAVAKDALLLGLQRNFCPSAEQIVEEVRGYVCTLI
jgi:hypothetical protein